MVRRPEAVRLGEGHRRFNSNGGGHVTVHGTLRRPAFQGTLAFGQLGELKDGRYFLPMKITQVAAQLYTCRETLKDPAGIAQTLRRLREVGYTAVQLSALGSITDSELNQILDDTGITCCATHEPGSEILNHPDRIVERLKALRCDITAYPFPAGVDFSDAAAVHALIASLQKAGGILATAGQRLCYHNHNHEFRKLEGKIILEMIYDGTSATALQGEPDTYWIQYGGGDNLEWCRKLAGRLPIIHLKDYQTTAQNVPHWCEIGSGVLDFREIISAAEASGCEWFVVEQDTCPGDPVESLAQSFRYIQEHLIS
jgi:sugar phosphate isomerase/epimerase